MLVNGKHYRTIWPDESGLTVTIIDQTKLPYSFEFATLKTLNDACYAISSMQVRGAPLIGATAGYGFALACQVSSSDEALLAAKHQLIAARPTAVNLAWAANRLYDHVMRLSTICEPQRPMLVQRKSAMKMSKFARQSVTMV
jgi:methylthioribose-1-phosphate isomerase